ncbi:glycosyltransferase [Echinicola sp. CAU 1574]|uniref:Glycosyltransferase n=1 Tax=Echinicola arenosa TaxID=2774144 RepID=A0ABR9ALN3_9BACT|nr:glycosyltransferase [Echinicola arenosa]MBD8488748.1 glycosyltransferase [Echinicola arenosa]
MKVLFVSSGNKRGGGIVPFISAQKDSLKKLGVSVDHYPIMGKGIKGYLRNIGKIKTLVKSGKYDIIHSHFVISGWIAVLAAPQKKHVLSLMGTDAYGRFDKNGKIKWTSKYLTLLTYLIQPFLSHIISKSENIAKYVYRKNRSSIIPNGVNIQKFYNEDVGFREELGLNPEKKYVLFLGNPKDSRKNFDLLYKAFEKIKSRNQTMKSVELLSPFPLKQETVIKYMNSVDILVLTSYAEGSPNLIKEAMACNCCIASTPVGDVEFLLKDCEGTIVSSFDPEKLAQDIEYIISKYKKSAGRERIKQLKITDSDIAEKIKTIYQKISA